ncbi:uncharacterized protein EI90DRAFT_3018996 [Cantharellus anzutake]|uniref:uncharacterized protein n=1 Tax=Cantharellus anzutake TaxID=1750568 RepID=UPI0019051BF8|nr:uncharacterized protein EI90DRAFT_3018996 [Cantharellus anzutake]KAF8325663.1 hypothetical protein EI90DRAFT_3018996 [Cantharellus anzutake]
MPPPLPDASGDTSNASILTLQASFSNSLTLLTTAPSVNDFLKATDGPFARLRSLVGQHTSTKDMPQFQPLAPLEDVVKNIVQELWGYTSVKAVRGGIYLMKHPSSQHCAVFMETCMAAYAQKRGKSPQEVMKKFHSHNATDTGQTAWQTWLKLHPGLDSQDAASLRKSEHLEIEEKYPDRADEAKAFYDKVLMHYGDIILSKRETQPNESVISIPGHRLPIPPTPPLYLHSFFTNLGAPAFCNPLGTPRWSPPPPFNLLPMPRSPEGFRTAPTSASALPPLLGNTLACPAEPTFRPIPLRFWLHSTQLRHLRTRPRCYTSVIKSTRVYPPSVLVASFVCTLSSTHPIGVTVVGFVADETIPPEQSTAAFTSSPIMAEMVKAMGLPLTEDAALAIRNLYDGIKAFSPYQPDISKQRSFLRHLHAFTNPDKSNNEEFGASGLMKSVVATARKSVHFHDSLDKYLTVKMEAMDENNIDYHTPILKRKDGLAMADKSYGPHS